MVHKIERLCGITLLLFVTFYALNSLAQGDETTNKGGKMKTSSVTGCVQKGDEPDGYTLKAEDGKVYELMGGGSANLGDHVGHTVTVTGSKTHESKADEKQRETSEKKESNGAKYTDFKVEEVKMVSDSCK